MTPPKMTELRRYRLEYRVAIDDVLPAKRFVYEVFTHRYGVAYEYIIWRFVPGEGIWEIGDRPWLDRGITNLRWTRERRIKRAIKEWSV